MYIMDKRTIVSQSLSGEDLELIFRALNHHKIQLYERGAMEQYSKFNALSRIIENVYLSTKGGVDEVELTIYGMSTGGDT